MKIIETLGNTELMERDKTLFICSKMTPIRHYDDVFRWTDSLSDRDCIACFNSTDMESEVLKALLVDKIPTVLFVMNRFTDTNNLQIEKALKENRMLIVVLKRDEPRGKGATPRLRNEYVLGLCKDIVCGYVNKNGIVFSMLAGRQGVTRLIDDTAYPMVAESELRHERWTVAQDKVLLRMFYADMGIHAIHKRLMRSYSAIAARIHNITQSEEILKGREFEDYVLSLLKITDDESLELLEWQSDKSYGLIAPKNNSHPDFVFRCNGVEFAIECKWREKIAKDLSKDLFPEARINNYTDFSKNRKMPVTIILGIGNDPSCPDSLYVIPLENIRDVIADVISIGSYRVWPEQFGLADIVEYKTFPKQYTFDEKRLEHRQAYNKWSKEDDEKLISLYYEGKSIRELMTTFERNEGSIKSRIRKLRLSRGE